VSVRFALGAAGVCAAACAAVNTGLTPALARFWSGREKIKGKSHISRTGSTLRVRAGGVEDSPT